MINYSARQKGNKKTAPNYSKQETPRGSLDIANLDLDLGLV